MKGQGVESMKQVEIRAKAFTGFGIQTIRATVNRDGTVRVYDPIAGYFTTCHSLSKSAQARIRKLHSEQSA